MKKEILKYIKNFEPTILGAFLGSGIITIFNLIRGMTFGKALLIGLCGASLAIALSVIIFNINDIMVRK